MKLTPVCVWGVGWGVGGEVGWRVAEWGGGGDNLPGTVVYFDVSIDGLNVCLLMLDCEFSV